MGKVKGHIPMRTCIVCGARRSKKELIRLAVDEEGQLLRDEFGKRQGRGAYICERKSCQEGLSKNKRVVKKPSRVRRRCRSGLRKASNMNFGGLNGQG